MTTYVKSRKTVEIGGITYVEHWDSVSKRSKEKENGLRVSEPVYACPGQFELTEKQIIDKYLTKRGKRYESTINFDAIFNAS